MSNQLNLPVYLEIELVPAHLNLSFLEWHNMPLQEFHENVEIVRKHIVENVIGKQHDFFGGNMTLDVAIKKLKNINYNNSAKLIVKPITKSIRNRNVNYASGIISYNTQATSVINRWFPEKSFSKNLTGKSVNDQFLNFEVFHNNVKALIKNNRFKFLSSKPNEKAEQFLKEGLRLVNGNQEAQNFPVDVAKWSILNYVERKLGTSNELFILDPCMGWGSRLVASLAICSNPLLKNKKVHYYGTEVNTSIIERYQMIVSFWKEFINPDINFELYHPSSALAYEDIFQDEVFQNLQGKFDIAFTSPPYCHTEKYSDDEFQSYIRYPKYDSEDEFSWKQNFLKPLFTNTYSLLKPKGEFWINIADGGLTNNGLNKMPLEFDSVQIAKQAGFHHKSNYKISMPTHNNFNKVNEKKSDRVFIIDGKRKKYEPLFVFVKTLELL